MEVGKNFAGRHRAAFPDDDRPLTLAFLPSTLSHSP